MKTVNYRWVCPLCGMTITSRWRPTELKEPVLVREYAYHGYKDIRVRNLTGRPVGWFLYVKAIVGWLADKFGLVKIKTVIRKIIPDYVYDRITWLEERLESLLQYIKVLEEENRCLNIQIRNVETHRLAWGSTVCPERRTVVRVKQVSRKELQW